MLVIHMCDVSVILRITLCVFKAHTSIDKYSEYGEQLLFPFAA